MIVERVIDEFKVYVSKCGHHKCTNKFVVEAWDSSNLEYEVKVIALNLPPLKAKYSYAWNCVTLNILGKNVGVYGSGKIMFCSSSLDEAEIILRLLREIISEARRMKIDEKMLEEELKLRKRASALKLYNYLPKTNCSLCGEKTCMAFAVKVLLGERKLTDCKLLSEPSYRHLIDELRAELGNYLINVLCGKSNLAKLIGMD